MARLYANENFPLPVDRGGGAKPGLAAAANIRVK